MLYYSMMYVFGIVELVIMVLVYRSISKTLNRNKNIYTK
jgi:hypothetical protein